MSWLQPINTGCPTHDNLIMLTFPNVICGHYKQHEMTPGGWRDCMKCIYRRIAAAGLQTLLNVIN